MSITLQDLMDACEAQAEWSKDSTYDWESYPTVAKSKYKGTCVTYVACTLQRLNILASGKYIWHTKKGKVTGATSAMKVIYPNNKTMHEYKNSFKAGDIVLDGDKSDVGAGSHILILTGQWNGNNPIVWDIHSAQEEWGAYEYDRNRSLIAVVRLLDIITYVPRLTSAGMNGSPYYYSLNPFYNAGYGLPNCTTYAWGRFWEASDPDRTYSNPPTLSTGNAEDWWNHTADGYERGQTPQLGAVLCLADGPYSGDGHVCIVEEIRANGDIVCSNSAWGGEYFYLTTLHPPYYLPVSGYIFQGFIYNPNAGGGDPWYGPSGALRTWMLKKWLWNREAELLQ